MNKSRIAAVITLAVTVLLGVVLASPAEAHTALKDSTPKKNAKVESLRRVVLEFSDSVRFPTVQVHGKGGEHHESGQPVVNGMKVSQAVDASLPPGDYTIAWRVVSEDGHPVVGEIPFTVIAPPASATPSAAATPVEASTADASTGAVAASETAAATVAASPAAAGQQDEPKIPGWLWVVVFGVAGIGIGMVLSLRKKP
jgi:copper resistance protein C